MNKTVKAIITVAVILAAMAIAYALGASGNALMVKEEQADMLVGMLITTQSLPESDDGRVYAECVDGEYVFKGIDGMQCFFTNKDNAIVSHMDEAFTDKSCGLHVINDDRDSMICCFKLPFIRQCPARSTLSQVRAPIIRAKRGWAEAFRSAKALSAMRMVKQLPAARAWI